MAQRPGDKSGPPVASAGQGDDFDAREDRRDGSGELGAAQKEVRDTALSAASSMRDTALEQGHDAVRRGKDGIAGQIDVLVSAVEASARELRGADSPLAAAADSVATHLRNTAQHLQDQNPKALAQEASDFARTHPLMFILGSAVAGFALARVARAGEADPERSGGPNREETAR